MSGLVDDGVPLDISFGLKEGKEVVVVDVGLVGEVNIFRTETKLVGSSNWHSLRRWLNCE